MTESKRETYWFVYPMLGLEFQATQSEDSSPLWGDATLLSRDRLVSIAEEYAGNRIFDNDFLADDIQCFLAVRRSGNLPKIQEGGDINKHFETRRAMEHAAARRAHAISAVIGFSLHLDGLFASALLEQFSVAHKSYLELNENWKPVGLTSAARGLSIGQKRNTKEAVRVEPGRLASLFGREPCRWLSQIILSEDSGIPQKLRNTIVEASICLSFAMHNALESSQLLGSITALELLLSTDDATFSSLQRRISALIGPEIAAEYRVSDTLDARHRYVHQGVKPEMMHHGWHAFSLALHSLLRYSQVANRLNNKQAILDYLDFLAVADRMPRHWSEDELAVHQSVFLWHPRTRFKLGVLY